MEFFCSRAHLIWSTRSRELFAALELSVDRLVRAFRCGLDERTRVSNRVTHSHDAIVHSASARRPGRWGPSRYQEQLSLCNRREQGLLSTYDTHVQLYLCTSRVRVEGFSPESGANTPYLYRTEDKGT